MKSDQFISVSQFKFLAITVSLYLVFSIVHAFLEGYPRIGYLDALGKHRWVGFLYLVVSVLVANYIVHRKRKGS